MLSAGYHGEVHQHCPFAELLAWNERPCCRWCWFRSPPPSQQRKQQHQRRWVGSSQWSTSTCFICVQVHEHGHPSWDHDDWYARLSWNRACMQLPRKQTRVAQSLTHAYVHVCAVCNRRRSPRPRLLRLVLGALRRHCTHAHGGQGRASDRRPTQDAPSRAWGNRITSSSDKLLTSPPTAGCTKGKGSREEEGTRAPEEGGQCHAWGERMWMRRDMPSLHYCTQPHA